ncbi:helix-turn-helix domain-containing protein [Vibrio sp. SS-MA-C1-2]|uniref:helix-turn-helix domain-containing protein n=1 Tax=Vibrio sp. SS-MA-C1-2 TaxID=2908646 RepID=UPI001F395471|nr:helix-turn-helix transcriptional regulator [Vibrio sp. SS-MA-C1-2]UJF17227.1 helix-turn-helix domain-containing protein [Vibrio sp. SS-MA-C1-2]
MMSLGKKIKSIRISEGLSQTEFSQLVDISIDSLRSYENERRTVNEVNLIKLTNHLRFKKYTLWLMTGEVAPEAGQVCPAFSIQAQCGIIAPVEAKKA